MSISRGGVIVSGPSGALTAGPNASRTRSVPVGPQGERRTRAPDRPREDTGWNPVPRRPASAVGPGRRPAAGSVATGFRPGGHGRLLQAPQAAVGWRSAERADRLTASRPAPGSGDARPTQFRWFCISWNGAGGLQSARDQVNDPRRPGRALIVEIVDAFARESQIMLTDPQLKTASRRSKRRSPSFGGIRSFSARAGLARTDHRVVQGRAGIRGGARLRPGDPQGRVDCPRTAAREVSSRSDVVNGDAGEFAAWSAGSRRAPGKPRCCRPLDERS